MADSKPLQRLLPDVRIGNDAHLDWSVFKMAFLRLAVDEGALIDPVQGVCAAFLSAARHLEFFGPASEPILHLAPILPAQPTAAQQHRYDRDSLAHERYQQATALLTRQWNAAVPESFWGHLLPAPNTIQITLMQKYEHMHATYDAIPLGVLHREKALLSKPISSRQPLSDFLKSARAFFRAAPGTSENERIQIAQAALSSRPELSDAFVDYFKANPHVQTFEGLVVHLHSHDTLALQLAPARAALAAIGLDSPDPASALSATAVSKSSSGPSAYCWSHGLDFHTSANCKNGFTGHKRDATKANKMGGFTHTWSKLSPAQKEAVRTKANA